MPLVTCHRSHDRCKIWRLGHTIPTRPPDVGPFMVPTKLTRIGFNFKLGDVVLMSSQKQECDQLNMLAPNASWYHALTRCH